MELPSRRCDTYREYLHLRRLRTLAMERYNKATDTL